MAITLLPSRLPVTGVVIIGNLGGALLTFAYFRFVDPTVSEGISALGGHCSTPPTASPRCPR